MRYVAVAKFPATHLPKLPLREVTIRASMVGITHNPVYQNQRLILLPC